MYADLACVHTSHNSLNDLLLQSPSELHSAAGPSSHNALTLFSPNPCKPTDSRRPSAQKVPAVMTSRDPLNQQARNGIDHLETPKLREARDAAAPLVTRPYFPAQFIVLSLDETPWVQEPSDMHGRGQALAANPNFRKPYL